MPGRVAAQAAQQPDSGPEDAGPGQQPERQAQAPESQVLPREGDRAARPLQGGWEIHVPGRLVAQLGDVRDPGRVGLEPEEARPAEGVGLEEAEDQQAGDRAETQVQDHRHQPALALGRGQLPQVEGEGRRQQGRGRVGAQLGGHGAAQGEAEAHREPEEGVRDQAREPALRGRRLGLRVEPRLLRRRPRIGLGFRLARAVGGDGEGEEERQPGEQVDEVVHRVEMRLLDLHHRQGRESRGQQPDGAVEEPAPDEEDQQHDEQVCQRREGPAHGEHLGKAGMPVDPLDQVAGGEKRQGAVDVKAVAAVVGVEGGGGGVPVIPQALHR